MLRNRLLSYQAVSLSYLTPMMIVIVSSLVVVLELKFYAPVNNTSVMSRMSIHGNSDHLF